MLRPILGTSFLVLALAAAGAQTPEWQVNSTAARMDVDGVLVASPFGPKALTPMSINQAKMVTVDSSLFGSLFEIGIAPTGLVPATGGGITSAGGQIVNMDLLHAGFIYGYGGGPVPLLRPFPGTLVFPVASPAPITASGQMIITNPSHADGYSLSQGCEINVAGPGSIPGPTGDDSSLQVRFQDPPLNGPPTVPFFGTLYTQFWVNSNGRVTFTGGDVDWSATVSEALGGYPFLGCWTDLDPSSGGGITITSLGLGMRVDWIGIPYYFEPATSVTFGLEICGACGAISVDGLPGIGANPASPAASGDSVFLGLSGGLAGGATNAGATLFALGSFGTPAQPTDMIYDFYDAPLSGGPARPASLVAGTLQRIQLTPAGNSYIWFGL